MALSPPESLPNRPVDKLLRFSCPMCATVLEIPRLRTGLEGPCPVCGVTIIAPSVVVTQTPQKRSPLVDDPSAPLPHEEITKTGADEASGEIPTARLCDLRPQSAVTPREAGNLPDPTPPKLERRRRKRLVVSVKHPTFFQMLKREFWLVLLALVVLAVAAAVALYGDEMSHGVEAPPTLQR